MIKTISANVAKWLVAQQIVPKDDVDLFSYAMYSLLWGLAPLLIVIVLGALFGMIYEGVWLIVPFIILRKFSGGYHLKSARWCLLSSTIILSLAFIIIKSLSSGIFDAQLSFAVLCAFFTIFHFSPIDSEARKLSDSEKASFRKIAKILSSIALFIYFLLMLYGSKNTCYPFGLGIIITAALQIPNILKARRKQ